MKNRYWIYLTVLVTIIFAVEYDLSRRMASSRKTIAKSAVGGEKEKSRTPAFRALPLVMAPTPDIFVAKFKEEAGQIGRLQMKPEEAEERMKKLTHEMGPEEIQALFEVVSNEKNDGDQRALAVELLSLKNDTASLLALQNFVANNLTVNGTKWDRKKELETVLRAQAVESIASFPQKEIALSTLSYLQSKVDETFLNDRIGRATANLQGHAGTIQEQDGTVLKKLVE